MTSCVRAGSLAGGSPYRPRKKFRRCRLIEFDDSPTIPKMSKVTVLEGDSDDSDGLPSVTTGMYTHGHDRNSISR